MSDDTSSVQPMGQFDIAAEQAVLGAMMTAGHAITDAERFLEQGDGFYRPAHTTIYRALLELRDRGEPTDPIALAAHMAGVGTLTKVGGAPYLHTCYAAIPSAANAAHFARIVAGCAVLRKLAEAGQRMVQLAGSAHHADAEAALERAREMLADLEVGGTASDTLRVWSEITPRVLDEVEQASHLDTGPPGVPTGLVDLDDILGGLRPGQLIYVAARPGVGKSVALIGWAQHAAMRLKLRTALFTLEMSELEVGLRLASSGAGVPLNTLRTGRLEDEDWTRLTRYVGETEEAPLHIDESPGMTLAHIRAGAKRLINQHGALDLLLVDYLQLVEVPNRRNRQEEVSALSRGLKLLAKEIGCPVVAACQLNRGPEQRSDKRPQLSDLRESGSLEQDADAVVLLHREDVRDQESARAGECDFIVAKNRHGRMDTITVAAQLHLSRFKSMALEA